MQEVLRALCSCFEHAGEAGDGPGLPGARFDSRIAGDKVAIDSDGVSVSGVGAALGNVALHQDRVYFEVRIVEAGSGFCIGVANKLTAEELVGDNLSGSDKAWCLSSQRSTTDFKVDDVIGCSFDQASGRPRVDFYLNGESLPGCAVVGCKGVVYPALSLAEGCKLRANFSQEVSGFEHPPPRGFDGIIASRSVM